jgi:glycosyltransferase involved in cell wall biosynthesis
MKIGINATSLNDRPSGAKNRFIGIYNDLFKQMHMHDFVIYQSRDCDMTKWFKGFVNVSFKTVPCKSTSRMSRFLAYFTFWRSELKSSKFDLLESLHQPIIKNPSSSGTTITTIYDVRGSREENWIKRLFYSLIIKSTIRNSDAIITISETIKTEILAIKKHRNINVVGCGISSKVSQIDKASEVFLEFSRLDFILSVGHLEDRKNYHSLIHAFSDLTKEIPKKHLVIVGNDNGEKAKLKNLINSLKLNNKITMLENLSDQDLGTIYNLSQGVIFPSLYEGFGIPILETMIYQKPLILSNINVFHEITKSHAMFFNPLSIAEITESMKMVFMQPDKFTSHIEYGKKRVNDFSFERLAADTRQIFELHHSQNTSKQ